MRNLRFFILFMVTVCVLHACKSRPDYVIDEDTMVSLLTDVHMSEGLLEVQGEQNRKNPEYGQEVMAAVLMKYNVSKEQYDTSMVWYSQNLQKLIRVYNKVNKRIDQNIEDWQTLAESSGIMAPFADGDSIEVWRHSRHIVFDSRRMTGGRVWRITADSTFHRGDTLQLRMHMPEQTSQQGIIASVSIVSFDEVNRIYHCVGGATSGFVASDSLVVVCCNGTPDDDISQVIVQMLVLRQSTDSVGSVPTYADSISLMRIHKK